MDRGPKILKIINVHQEISLSTERSKAYYGQSDIDCNLMAFDEQGDDFYNLLCDLTDGDRQDIVALFDTSSKEPAANPTSLYDMTAQAGYDDPTGSEGMLGADLAFPGNGKPLPRRNKSEGLQAHSFFGREATGRRDTTPTTSVFKFLQ